MLATGLTAGVGLTAPITGSEAGSFGPDQSQEKKDLLLRSISEFSPVCEATDEKIIYIGPTELGLVHCLLDLGPAGATQLEITSSGGSVPTAIWAAQLVETFRLRVSVASFCASSCANYILPAAREVVILPYSIVTVHGAPGLPDREALEKQLVGLGRLQSSQSLESAVENNMSRLGMEYNLHLWFRDNFRVHPNYYLLEGVEPEGEAESGIVSSAWLRDCLSVQEISALGENDGTLDNATIDRLFGAKYRYFEASLADGLCG